MKRRLTLLFAGAVLASLSTVAAARDNISFSISIGTPAYAHVPTVVYHAPPPVYYVPSTVYYHPAPLVRVTPAPVVHVAPAPRGFIAHYDHDRRSGQKRSKHNHGRWNR
jgi:hypothetical protein